MSPRILMIAAVFSFVLLLPVHAAELDMFISPGQLTTTPDTAVSADLRIANNQEADDNVTITITGPHLEWVQDGVYLLAPVPAKSTFANKLTFYPVGEAFGEYTYQLTATSLLDSTRSASASVRMMVGYRGPPAITSFSAARQGENLQLSFTAAAPTPQLFTIAVHIKNQAGQPVGTFVVQETVENIKTFQKTVTLAKDLPVGAYQVEASLDGGETQTSLFSIAPVRNVVTEETTIKGNWYDEVTITATNKGNVQEDDYMLQYPVPADKLTGFVTASDGCTIDGGEKTCSFALPPLAPGEVAKVVYRIEYWPSLAGFAAGGVLLLLFAGLGFISMTRPRISKSVAARKGGLAHIILEVRSPRLKDAQAVIVRDLVSPVAEVLYKEFESLKPVIRKTEAGTELIWKIGDMKAREQRLLSYKIRPLVEGALKMPQATLKYSTAADKRYRLTSRSLTV